MHYNHLLVCITKLFVLYYPNENHYVSQTINNNFNLKIILIKLINSVIFIYCRCCPRKGGRSGGPSGAGDGSVVPGVLHGASEGGQLAHNVSTQSASRQR